MNLCFYVRQFSSTRVMSFRPYFIFYLKQKNQNQKMNEMRLDFYWCFARQTKTHRGTYQSIRSCQYIFLCGIFSLPNRKYNNKRPQSMFTHIMLCANTPDRQELMRDLFDRIVGNLGKILFHRFCLFDGIEWIYVIGCGFIPCLDKKNPMRLNRRRKISMK